MAEPRGPHDPPIYLPPNIPRKLDSEADVLHWQKWVVQNLARGGIEPQQGREITHALKAFLELKWLIGSGQKRMSTKDEQIKPLRDLDADEVAEIKDRERRCREIQALADKEDAAEAAAAALLPAPEPEVEGPAIVVDLAGLLRAAADRRELEQNPARAIEQPPYRAHPHPAIELDRPPNLGRELAQEEF